MQTSQSTVRADPIGVADIPRAWVAVIRTLRALPGRMDAAAARVADVPGAGIAVVGALRAFQLVLDDAASLGVADNPLAGIGRFGTGVLCIAGANITTQTALGATLAGFGAGGPSMTAAVRGVETTSPANSTWFALTVSARGSGDGAALDCRSCPRWPCFALPPWRRLRFLPACFSPLRPRDPARASAM